MNNDQSHDLTEIREIVDASLGDPEGQIIELEIDTDPNHPDACEEG